MSDDAHSHCSLCDRFIPVVDLEDLPSLNEDKPPYSVCRNSLLCLRVAIVELERRGAPGSPKAMAPLWDLVHLVERECGNEQGKIYSSLNGIITATIKVLRDERDALRTRVEAAERLATAACRYKDLHHLISAFDATDENLDDQRAAFIEMSNEIEETDTMPFINGKSFHCEMCGANVFRRFVHNHLRFQCNGCGETYTGK